MTGAGTEWRHMEGCSPSGTPYCFEKSKMTGFIAKDVLLK
jgi:hypothetical protein